MTPFFSCRPLVTPANFFSLRTGRFAAIMTDDAKIARNRTDGEPGGQRSGGGFTKEAPVSKSARHLSRAVVASETKINAAPRQRHHRVPAQIRSDQFDGPKVSLVCSSFRARAR
jgi:hypothetical protein